MRSQALRIQDITPQPKESHQDNHPAVESPEMMRRSIALVVEEFMLNVMYDDVLEDNDFTPEQSVDGTESE